MAKSRRQFLNRASLALIASASACRRAAQTSAVPPPGAPAAFGTAPPVGPPVLPETFAEAEKLVQVGLSPAARRMGSCKATDCYRACRAIPERKWERPHCPADPAVEPAGRPPAQGRERPPPPAVG